MWAAETIDPSDTNTMSNDTESSYDKKLFPHGRWLLCRPDFYDVRYQINPWMDVKRAPAAGRAMAQWRMLHHTILRLGGWIEWIDQGRDVPDMVFTANGGMIRGDDVVLARFRYAERQPEAKLFREWFERDGFRVMEVTKGDYEGEGDSLLGGDVLYGGFGFRSDRPALEEVGELLNVKTVVTTELTDPRFYHLDTCFCPITPSLAIAYPPALAAEGLKAIEKHTEVLPVPASDAEKFVCNAVVLGKSIVVPAGVPTTRAMLESRGFAVHEVALDEFIKAGGAAKCLSLKLDGQ